MNFIMKQPFLKMKKPKLSVQQLELILKSSHSRSSYTVIKTILDLPFETSESFLKQYDIDDSYHFVEHINILYTQKSVIEVLKNQLISLIYPFFMLVSSSLLLRIFINQFQVIMITMNISIPNSVKFVMFMHVILFVSLVVLILFLLWIQKTLYRRVIFISLFRKTKVFRLFYEIVLITVIQSLPPSQLSLKEIHTLISKHSSHALMRIMSNDLKQIIEEGKTLMVWLENFSSFPSMKHWVYEQINQADTSNLALWNNQLQIGLKQIFIRWKSLFLTCCYALIAFNILAMLSIFNLPYEWIHQL